MLRNRIYNNRLSIIEWQILGDQVANSINNLPIAIGNIVQGLENMDILTPNRLMLARNNDRCPIGTLAVTEDIGKIVKRNTDVFNTWVKCWLISYVPTLILQPKWYRDPKIGGCHPISKVRKGIRKEVPIWHYHGHKGK